MNGLELLLIAIALAFDSFAVSVSVGFCMNDIKSSEIAKLAGVFGIFHVAMVLAGGYGGEGFEQLIKDYDHWLAFILLTLIGGRMVIEAFHGHEEHKLNNIRKNKVLTIMAFATSLDALAMGFSIAFLDMPILLAAVVIGISAAGFTVLGVKLGKRVGTKFSDRAEIAGGVILILIGLRVLAEHLSV